MALSDELSEALAHTVEEKQAASGQQSGGQWIPYQGPEGGEGWQNVESGEVRYQQDPPGEVAEGYEEDHWGSEGGEESDGKTPLEPREDPHEFESDRDLSDVVDFGDKLWRQALEFTPFDSIGEVPIGTEVEFSNVRVQGDITGEVVGYFDGDAEIGEPNGLVVETEKFGEKTVFPKDFEEFNGPVPDNPDEYLSDPFTHAVDIKGAREAGIGAGNTTGASMKILTMSSGDKIFATPTGAYNHTTTGVVSGPAEAKRNNLNSPTVIEHLGGNACDTEIVQGDDGREYIAKEGIEGELMRNKRHSINNQGELQESLERTLASAFFVGNADLHGANIIVNEEEQEVTIIDHDKAGPGFGSWYDVDTFTRAGATRNGVRGEVYDITRDYMRGDLDLPDEIKGTSHEDYFKKGIDRIVNKKKYAEVFDPWEGTPHDTVDGFETMDDFEEGMEVTVLSGDGRIRTAELSDRYQGTWYGQTDDNYEVTFDMPHHVLEVHDKKTGSPPLGGDTVPVEPENPELVDMFGHDLQGFEEGDQITVKPYDLQEEEVVVEEYDGEYDRLRVHAEGDPDDVFHVDPDDIVEGETEDDSE